MKKIDELIHLLLDEDVSFLDAETESNTDNAYRFIGWWDEKKEKFIIELEFI